VKHEESNIQQKCVEWFKYNFPTTVIASFPNGAFLGGTPVQRAKRWNILKREGAMLGIPDLIICMPSGGYHGLFIEMKTPKGKLSENQIACNAQLEFSGYCVKVCRSFDDFRNAVNTYLEY
jgi:hypothetical protein